MFNNQILCILTQKCSLCKNSRQTQKFTASAKIQDFREFRDSWFLFSPSHYKPPIGSTPPRVNWSRDQWRHVTPKGQTHDPIIFEVPYLRNGAR